MAPQLHDSLRPSCFLLRLPLSIRRRIYLHLGIARWDGFPMLFDLDGLLLSCRLVYGEASALLHVRGHGNDVEPSLQPLRNLTASSLASLASVKIAGGKCCDDIRDNGTRDPGYCQRHHTTHHDKPLQSSYSTDMAGPMLDEWLRTEDYLSSRISPRALRLALVCDLGQEKADIDTATRVDCHIRLCRTCRRPEPSPSSSSLGLLSLPRELRLHILEYTDLVTPWREVMWTKLERGYQYPAEGCYPQDDIPCPPNFPWHYGCQFQGCHHQERIMIDDDIYSGSIGCFCRLRHAAFSSACKCWAPPTPLFLICRTLSQDAKFVFFSLNRFVVCDTLASLHPCTAFNVFKTFPWPEHGRYWELAEWREAQPPRAYPAERFAVSQFLREVVPADCLSYLRFLELVFPPYNHKCWPYDGHPALQDWIETIDWVKNKIRTPGITLRLTMAGSISKIPERPDDRQELSRAQGDEVLAGYNRTLKPLACLGGHGKDGLAQFYADFAWPWKWTSWAYERRRDIGYKAGQEWTKSKEDVLNERGERFILETDMSGFLLIVRES
ncbi:hypothetical protein C8A00DRAFT_44557 [Chaetomidium leptoderma]|uniref:Uncharacterized protein n=1 Tax=Chaetomidium leptoderma TaxID=669021 RepID=A0AAN6ZUH8_9PEZI|nr:hypothetical protein C8A00DRAFT_44557 [Chaetomidium leptoderma]